MGMFSEMGCPGNQVPEAPQGQSCRKLPGMDHVCPRNWNQVPDFFQKFPMFDGFAAYAFWNSGVLNFNMADGQFGNATLYDDGKNFFNQTKQVKPGKRSVTQGT